VQARQEDDMERLWMAAALCAAALTLVSCSRGGATVPAADNTPTVPVAKVSRANLSGELTLTAEFTPFQEVDVMAKVAGYVQSIKVDVGDRVREGQLLATLEIPEMEDELAKAGASVHQADAEVVTARDELRRAESAHELQHLSYTRIQDVAKREKGLVPQQQVDEYRSRDLVAEAQVAAAKSSLVTAEQKTRVARAEEARVRTLQRYTSITAPFAGVVTKRFANTGSMIQAGTASQSQAMPVVRLSQNNLLRLILPVPESVVSKVRVGAAVDVKVPNLGGKRFPGRVARLTDKVQMATRTMDTEVDVPNPALELVPGMYAEVNLHVEERRDVLALPLDAIETSGMTSRVYAVSQSGVIRVVPVTLGLETPQKVEIRTGLDEGEMVVVGRKAGLKEGERVQAKLADFLAEGK
jgi:RND family efflux transporter MFP subunit